MMKTLDSRKRSANSNAVLISIGIHVLILLIAGNIVALRFYKDRKKAASFESTERPKLELRKLDMKVNVQKPLLEQMSHPKLKQTSRITAAGKQAFNLPAAKSYTRQLALPTFKADYTNDFSFAGLMTLNSKFREITYGVSEVEVFGVRGKGEKIVFVVDASRSMLHDRLGGANSYQIMKEGFNEIVQSIGSATIFNVILFDGDKVAKFHPKLSPASTANKEAAIRWFAPINAIEDVVSSTTNTVASNVVELAEGDINPASASNTVMSASNSNLLAIVAEVMSSTNRLPPGIPAEMVNYTPPVEYDCPMDSQDIVGWLKGLQAALEYKPDTIFLIGADWGPQTTAGLGLSYFLRQDNYAKYQALWANSYQDDDEKEALTEYMDNFAIARKGALMMLEEENRARREKGLPPKVARDWDEILVENGLGIPEPPRSSNYETVSLTPADTRYTTEDLVETLFTIAMENYGKIGFPRINYLLFAAEKIEDTTDDLDSDEEVIDKRLSSEMKYRALARFCRGRFNLLEGSEAMENLLEQEFPEILEKAEDLAEQPLSGTEN